MARDGQGLEVGNADTGAIEALDFLNEEWLRFGNKLDRFVAAADREESCAMLPVMAANLVFSMNSTDGHAAGVRYLEKARTLARGANARERAWLAATAAYAAGDGPAAQKIHEDMATEWPRDLMSAKLGQLHAFNCGDAEGILRIGDRILPANSENHYAWAMRAFGLEECNRLDEAEVAARKAIGMERR
ncbi:MAG TPA: hypothetical protein VK634_18450, partial [Reyranella sp.]|nr:hypothetical protein [Reyranella sp.]